MRFPTFGLAIVMLLGATHADASTITITTTNTFLHVDSGDTPVGATIPIDLLTLGFVPGNTIQLTQLGAYDCGFAGCNPAMSMIAVFSSSTTLLGSTFLNRVSGAIDAGNDVLTFGTFPNVEPTDIAQDFEVLSTGTIVMVPTGARYLFVAAWDDFYNDNLDREEDFAVSIQAVPEPATFLLLGLGLAGLAMARRRVR